MNRSDLVDEIARRNQLPRRTADMAVGTVFTSISDALAGGDRIEIRGFGSFAPREYEGYTGRNPKTGKAVSVSSKRLPFFRVGKELREIVDETSA
jgi:integration host factor subunit beta